MASGQMMWGLDVGKCALKAVKIRLGAEGGIELLATDFIEHEQILSQPDADREALIATALETFLSRNDITDAPVVVGVPGQHTLARFSKLPPVEAKKIAEIVRYEAEQQIPFDMDEVIWDYQTFQEEDTPDIEVGIFAMKRDLIRDYLLHYEQAGIEPAAVQSAPLAVYNAAHFDGLLGAKTTVLLDIGAENTDLIIASPVGLWTRTIPLGGNSFTDTLVKAFKLSFGKAESLKRTAASSKYARQIFQTMRPVFADLVQELQRSIGFYSSTHRDAELDKVVGLGNAFKLPGLQKYLQQNLGMDVERPERFSKLLPVDGVDMSAMKENSLSFAVAYGLAIQGLKESKIVTNLLPPEIARAVVWRKKRTFFGAAAACLLLTAGVIWARQLSDQSTLSENQGDEYQCKTVQDADRIIEQGPDGTAGNQARQILGAAKFYRNEHQSLMNQGAGELDEIAQVVALSKNKYLWTDILGAIHGALPEPPAELAGVSGPAEYKAVIDSVSGGPLARENRDQIIIDQMVANYYADMRPVTDNSEKPIEVMSDEGGGESDAIEGAGTEGFVVKLWCSTPNKEALSLANRTFKGRLRELGRVPGRGFYINRIWLTDCRQPYRGGQAEGDTGAGSQGSGRRGSSRRRGRDTSTGTQPPGRETKVDPVYDFVTGELKNDDWAFKMTIEVVLGELPESALKKPSAGNEGSDSGG